MRINLYQIDDNGKENEVGTAEFSDDCKTVDIFFQQSTVCKNGKTYKALKFTFAEEEVLKDEDVRRRTS